jgi:hypothetical protein
LELKEFENKSDLKVDVEIRNITGKTELSAKICGDISDIDFPKISDVGMRKNGLWLIGCFEIFVSRGDDAYTEYNLGFDKNWEIFNFSHYRSGQKRPQIKAAPNIICKLENDSFTQVVDFYEDIIAGNFFSITAVVKLFDGGYLYFANKHCGQKPDFHIKDARILKLF